jgi:predicted dehydrogenase
MSFRMIQVGTGGFGGWWCERFLPPNVERGRIEVVAAVDRDPQALENARRYLGLPADKCYTSVERAFADNPADFCTVVVPPQFHEQVVDLALAHDLHILSEKPIADTFEGSVRIAEKVRRAGKKMGVTMSHRFDRDKTTLREQLRRGEHGALGLLAMRFASNNRGFGSWGVFRHEMAHPLLIEGAIHHLDILADLADGECTHLYAQSWNAPWAQYASGSSTLVTMEFDNGVRAVYEGSLTSAVGSNVWGQEYLRAECEFATLVLDHRRLELFPYDPDVPALPSDARGRSLALLEGDEWGHVWLIRQFVDWLDGGAPMETDVEANLRSIALTFAAVESARTGAAVDVAEFVRRSRAVVTDGAAGA